MNHKEEWEDIKGYEGLYQVSNKGRVKSLSRLVKFPDNRKSYTIKEKILNSWEESGGYLQVSLSKNSKVRNVRVHVLVAIAFLNHIPNGSTVVVDRIDEDRKNNNLDNLQIIGHQENIKRSRR